MDGGSVDRKERAGGWACRIFPSKGWLLAVLASLLLSTACQRVLPEAPAPSAPNVPEPGPPAPVVADDEPFVDPGAEAVPPPPPPEVDVDPILGSPWATHPELEARIDFWVDYWTGRGSEHFHRYLERMHRYRGLVDGELERRSAPPSLRYLPIVESGYNPVAVSRVGATGLWQIMPGTADYLGLPVDRIVDRRRDPVASTVAALDYLEGLHGQFGSWFLALAAYNAGPGRVGRALAAHIPGEDYDDGTFLEVRPNLPAETREFVPRFFAAARIARNPEGYGFSGVEPQAPYRFEVASVPGAASLDVIARTAGVSQAEVEALNPHLLRGFTPAGRDTEIRLPQGAAQGFAVRFAQLPPEERVTFIEHVVSRGETLTHLARQYGVSLADLQAANGQVDPRSLQIGQRLVVPRGAESGLGATAVAASARGGGNEGGSEGRELHHEVRPGESLWSIANAYGVSLEELRTWNGLSEEALLHPGEELTVRTSGQVLVHRVARGDTLSGIASRYGVATQDLARANGLGLTDVIRPGEELTVPSASF